MPEVWAPGSQGRRVVLTTGEVERGRHGPTPAVGSLPAKGAPHGAPFGMGQGRPGATGSAVDLEPDGAVGVGTHPVCDRAHDPQASPIAGMRRGFLGGDRGVGRSGPWPCRDLHPDHIRGGCDTHGERTRLPLVLDHIAHQLTEGQEHISVRFSPYARFHEAPGASGRAQVRDQRALRMAR